MINGFRSWPENSQEPPNQKSTNEEWEQLKSLVAILVCILSAGTLPAKRPSFSEVAKESGIDFQHHTGASGHYHYPEIMGAGVILFDYDGDADLDIYLINGNHLSPNSPDPGIINRLYRNDSSNGDLRFSDVTLESGLADSGYGQGGEAADFDGDGDQDLFLTNLGWDVLFRNEGNGRFTRASLPSRQGWGQTSSALDYDGDGDLDLFVANYLNYDPASEPQGTTMVKGKVVKEYRGPHHHAGLSSLLLRNDGDLKFTDVSSAAGLDIVIGKGMGAACLDLDGDGAPDIYQANDAMENFFFRNLGGRFEEVALATGTAVRSDGHREGSMGVDVADVDGNGLPDLMIPCYFGEVHTLYLNEWPFFDDGSVKYGLRKATRHRTGFSPSFLDYDNDGDEDLFISCGRVEAWPDAALREDATYLERYGEPPVLLENDGKGRFHPVGESAGPYFLDAHIGRGTAVADLDQDGDLDLVVNHADAGPALLRNDTKGGNWLRLSLIGKENNRDAIGARIRAQIGDKTLHRWLRGGGSYLSVSSRTIHLGLGAATSVDRIEIKWPSGKTTLLEDVPGGQVLRVLETDG
jgi:hypothetical protein